VHRGGSRCSIRGLCAPPVTPPDPASAWSTSSGSPVSRWCSRCSCRTGWTYSFLQDGLDYSPLRSGLTVTPFALGMAASAVIAGRLVSRFGRWLTVCGLTAVTVGMIATALVLRHTTGDAATWAIVGPVFVAGLGGGMVTSPNMTLTLQYVPVEMAGVAGGRCRPCSGSA
jgi:MFS family permease